jgi:hydroxyacylglutathione hydrolase
MAMHLEQILTGGDRNFGYLIVHGTEAMLVDPGEEPQALVQRLQASGAKLRWILGTHDHVDHIASMNQVHEDLGGERILSSKAESKADLYLGEESLDLKLGGSTFCLIPTPGHTACSLCLLMTDEAGDAHLITGDTLFVGKIGGCPDLEAAQAEYTSLQSLLELDDAVHVWPGHNYGTRPMSSIGEERRENPFLLRRDFEDFCWLKENWAQYKSDHGIA